MTVMPEVTIELPAAWRTAPIDPHMVEVVATAELPRGRRAFVVYGMLEDGTNVLALAWDRGTRLARCAYPDWKLEERFTGRPPGPGEGKLIEAWKVGVDAMLAAMKRAAADEATDPEGSERQALAVWVSRHPEALDMAYETFRVQPGVPEVTRDEFAQVLDLMGRGEFGGPA